MEFQYFLDTTPIDQDNLLYLASGRSFGSVQNLGFGGLEEFTFIGTFEKQNANASVLISQHSLNSGWVIGFTSNNELYVDCRGINKNYKFDNLTLGKKNCFAIKKAGNTFSAHIYDLYSNEIRQSQSISFPQNIDNNVSMLIGSGSGYAPSGISALSGYFDQYCLFDIPIEESYLLKLFSGFQPYTKSSTTGTSYSLISDIARFPLGTGFQTGFFVNYIANYNSWITSNLSYGNWISESSGMFSSATGTATGRFSTGIDYCNGTGTYFQYSLKTGGAGTYRNDFTDTVHVLKESGKLYISHNIYMYDTGINTPYSLDTDSIYHYTESVSNSFIYNSGYLTGFYMNGVTSDISNRISLGTNTGIAPTGINLQGYFDQSLQKFFINGFSNGRLFYNGNLASSYSISDNYLNYTGVTQIDSDYVIADSTSLFTFLNSGVYNNATGKFFPGAAMVYSGIFGTGRMKESNYKETSIYSLYHNAAVQQSGAQFLFSL